MTGRKGPVWILSLVFASSLLAQRSDDAGKVAGCACCSTVLVLPIAAVASAIILLVWVAKDAKARGMDNAVTWMLVVFFLHLLGLIIYMNARPKGDLVLCPSCNNKRLKAGVKCPHCGNP